MDSGKRWTKPGLTASQRMEAVVDEALGSNRISTAVIVEAMEAHAASAENATRLALKERNDEHDALVHSRTQLDVANARANEERRRAVEHMNNHDQACAMIAAVSAAVRRAVEVAPSIHSGRWDGDYEEPFRDAMGLLGRDVLTALSDVPLATAEAKQTDGTCSVALYLETKARAIAAEEERDAAVRERVLFSATCDFANEQAEKARAETAAAVLAFEEERRHRLKAESDHGGACATIAKMHAAAVGELRGPTCGIVEDVEDLRKDRDAAESRFAASEEERHTLERDLFAALGLDALAHDGYGPDLVRDVVKDRDGWKEQHENALGCWRRESDHLVAQRDAAKAETWDVRNKLHLALGKSERAEAAAAQAQEDLRGELDGARFLRAKYGAREGESFEEFVARLAAGSGAVAQMTVPCVGGCGTEITVHATSLKCSACAEGGRILDANAKRLRDLAAVAAEIADAPPSSVQPPATARKPCTCVSECRGQDGLGAGWRCKLLDGGVASRIETCATCGQTFRGRADLFAHGAAAHRSETATAKEAPELLLSQQHPAPLDAALKRIQDAAREVQTAAGEIAGIVGGGK